MRLLRLWPDGTKFDFMRFRRLSFPFSALLSIATIVVFLTMGLNFGVDFKGGTLMELQAKSAQADEAKVRHTANSFGTGEGEAQEFGNAACVSLRLPVQPGGGAAQSAVVQKTRE